MNNFKLPYRLHGLRAQVLLWTVLPLTIFLIVFALSGVSSHQSSMRALAIEEKTQLVSVMADLVAASAEIETLREGIEISAVSADHLNLKDILHINHSEAVSTIVLMDEQGRVLFNQGDIPTGAAFAAWEGVVPALQRENGALFISTPIEDDVIAYAPVPGTEWVLLIREAWHSVTAPLIRFEQLMPFILFTASVVSLLTLFFGVRFVVQPLRELSMRAVRIGSGEFAGKPVNGVQEIEDLSHALDEMAARVQSYQAALHDYAGEVTRAQEEERGRLARELHDETVQTLIALGHKAQMAQRTLHRDQSQADERIAELRDMIGDAIEEVRRFSRALHPHYLEELGLVSALEVLARESRAQFEVQGNAVRLKPEHELTLYRIAQEALNNAAHHAQAQRVTLKLHFEAHCVKLDTCDDGQGFVVPPHFSDFTRIGHFGLISMRERAQLVSGRLVIDSEPGEGTHVSFVIPL